MVVLLALMQWSHMFFVHQTLQHAAREAGRLAVVGATNYSGTTFASVEAAARAIMYSNSAGLLPSPNAQILFSNRTTTNQDFGGPNSTFTIRVNYRYGYHTPLIPFFNALFNGNNHFNNNSNLVVSTTFVAEKYNDDFL